jgi:hypothetical protein
MLKMKRKYKNDAAKTWKCGLVCFFIWAYFTLSTTSAEVEEVNSNLLNYGLFFQAIEKTDDANAMSLGKPIFEKMEQKYSNDEGFKTYTSRLNVAAVLTKEMISQLDKARQKQMFAFAETLFDKKKENKCDSI